MKTLSILIGIALLAGCSSLRMGGTSGSDDASTPYSQRVFDPNDPYHGG